MRLINKREISSLSGSFSPSTSNNLRSEYFVPAFVWMHVKMAYAVFFDVFMATSFWFKNSVKVL